MVGRVRGHGSNTWRYLYSLQGLHLHKALTGNPTDPTQGKYKMLAGFVRLRESAGLIMKKDGNSCEVYEKHHCISHSRFQ